MKNFIPKKLRENFMAKINPNNAPQRTAALRNILASYNAYMELKDSGWLPAVEKVMNEPDVVVRLLRLYDLNWNIEDDIAYKKMLDNWKKMMDSYLTFTDPVTGQVYTADQISEAIMLHMMLLQRARPVYYAHKSLTKLTETQSTYEIEEPVSIAAEEEVAYRTYNNIMPSRSDEWISVRNSEIVPDNQECVLVAGYYLPGLLVYKTAIYLQDEHVYDVDISDEKPFTLLYWKRIGPAPKDYIDQI